MPRRVVLDAGSDGRFPGLIVTNRRWSDLSASSIWDKIDLSVIEDANDDQQTPQDTSKSEANWKRRFYIANIVASILWLFTLTKLFIFDIDRFFVDKYAPNLSWLIDLKFFGILASLAIVILVIRKSWLWILYFIFFPCVILCWYMPRYFYRTQNWPLLVATVNTAFGFIRSLKRNLAIRTLEAFALLLIVAAVDDRIQWICVAVIGAAVANHYMNALLAAVASSRFLSSQRELLRRLMTNPTAISMMTIDPKLKASEVEKFSKPQLDIFVSKVSLGIFAVSLVEVYLNILNKYRLSAYRYFMPLLSFVWLFVHTVVGLTFINYALWHIDPGQFEFDREPNLLYVAYYSLWSLYGNTVIGLSPVGGVAILLSILAGFIGPLLLLTLFFQMYMSYRQNKDEREFNATMSEISSQKAELESRLSTDYEVSIEEAMQRLVSCGLGGAAIFVNLAARIAKYPAGSRTDVAP